MPLISSFSVVCLALTSLSIASPIELDSRQTVPISACVAPLHLIVGGGDNRSPGMQNVNGLLQPLINSINSTFPHTTEYLPPYDGTATPGPAANRAFDAAVKKYAASCPLTPIVMLGYSFGGVILMDTLCGGISSQYTKNIIAAIAYGEETRVAGQSYDKGTCKTSSPGTYAKPRPNPAACDPYASRIQSYCLASDPYCCATGTNTANHFLYAQKYDAQALAFIKRQYETHGGSL